MTPEHWETFAEHGTCHKDKLCPWPQCTPGHCLVKPVWSDGPCGRCGDYHVLAETLYERETWVQHFGQQGPKFAIEWRPVVTNLIDHPAIPYVT